MIFDTQYSETVRLALAASSRSPALIEVEEGEGDSLGGITYQEFLTKGEPEFRWQPPDDEWQSFSLNYTSGTTGNPKGVVYSHRGVYLNALGNQLSWPIDHRSKYLWTLPMFHCNGWCFPFTVTAMAATHVCLRQVSAQAIISAIVNEGITHFCCAPTVLNFIIDAPEELKHQIPRDCTPIKAMVAGAPAASGTHQRS